MRDRIFGYENEFALLIAPESDQAGISLKRIRIYDYLEYLISTHLKVLPANYRKKGIFLENGGLFNYEALHSDFFEGMLEMATPECRDPREVALYHTAQTQLLFKLIRELNDKIWELDPGFRGRISIGKSNVDSSGKCIGCHENYMVEDDPGTFGKIILWLTVPIFWLIHLIILAITFIPIIIFTPLIILLSLVAGSVSGILVLIPHLERIGIKIKEFVFNFLLHEEFLINQFARVHGDFSRIIFFPWVWTFSTLLSGIIFRKIRRELIPFIVTRMIFCGAGKVNLPEVKARGGQTETPIFEISARARAIRSICRIFFDDDRRPIIDLRDFFLEPLTVLKKRKRLHILLSDANMSSIGIYLKIGITGLILEMIEDGCTFPEVHMADPLKALGIVSGDTSMKAQIPLRKGQKSALEIQRIYLERAKEHFSKKDPKNEKIRDLLEKWEYMLGTLEIAPGLLYRKVDWVTKKDLLEQVLIGRGTLQELKEASVWISRLSRSLGGEIPPENLPIAFIEESAGQEAFDDFKRFLYSSGLSYNDFLKRWRLFFELLKVDFKFHELNDDGYYYRLLGSDLVDRLFSDEEIAQAELNPPERTRANIRGELIKRYGYKYNPYAQENYAEKVTQSKCKIGWNKFYLSWPWKKITMSDPFDFSLSSIENHLDS